MGSFDSPIGGKRFAGQQLKEVDVPDESEFEDSGYPEHINVNQAIKGMKPLDEAGIRAFQARLAREQNEVDSSQVEHEIRQTKADKRMGRERLNEGARKRIEMLVGMTRNTRTAEIEGNTYILQTLKAKEMRETIAASAEFDGTVHAPFEMRRQFLARSLIHVVGIDIEQFLGSNDLSVKLNFIDEMDDILLNRLYDEYMTLVNDSRNKYAIKQEAVQEVVDDLKK
jgi:hypothetical protein